MTKLTIHEAMWNLFMTYMMSEHPEQFDFYKSLKYKFTLKPVNDL